VRKIHVIGIGAGDPDQLTLQAVRALRSTDVFFILEKGEVKADLTGLRRDLLDAHVPQGTYRVVEARDPERDRSAGGAAYSPAVGDWRSARAEIYERLIAEELGEEQTGAFLVWGDPSLYDSTLGILEEVLARGAVAFEYDVVPGISSVSALVARHRTGLNRVARPVQITTGRRLAEGFPEGVDDGAPTSAPRTRSSSPARSPRPPPASSGCGPRPASARAGSWTRICCGGTPATEGTGGHIAGHPCGRSGMRT
jgi:precorrin-6A synthase